MSFVLCTLFLCSFKTVNAQEKDLYISEINWAGSSSSSADEWVELFNSSNNDIDLSNYQLSFMTSSGEKYLQLSGIAKNSDYFLIANNGKDHNFTNGQSILNVDPDYISTSLSLSNTTLEMKLLKNDNDILNEIDRVGDGKYPFFGSTEPYRSMQRIASNDGVNNNSFQSSYVCVNLDSCENNYGTPKTKNIFIPNIVLTNNEKNYEVNSNYLLNYNINFVNDDKRELETVLNYGGKTISAIKTQDSVINYNLSISNTGCNDLILNVNDEYKIEQVIKNEICFYKNINGLEIEEILANPNQNENEYIVLKNNSNEIIDLENYYLDDIEDGGSKPFMMINLIILPKTVQKIELDGKIILNDSGDEVRILNPNLTELIKVAFASSKDGEILCQKNNYQKCNSNSLPNLLIQSILPYPTTDNEEEIIIENLSQEIIDLENYYLKDKSEKKFVFHGRSINGKEKILLKYSETKINLNNTTSEALTLFSPSNYVLSVIEYDKAKQGIYYTYINNQYVWQENNVYNDIQVATSNQQNIEPDVVYKNIININNEQLLDNYVPNQNVVKGVKNIDKMSGKGYNNNLVLVSLIVTTLWKLLSKILTKV